MRPIAFRQSPRWLPALALAVATVTVLSAVAYSVPSGRGAQITTDRPDLVSATILQAATISQPARVRFCFDEPIAPGSAGGGQGQTIDAGDAAGFRLRGYDAGDRVTGTSAAPASGAEACADVEFQPAGGVAVDVTGYTIAAVEADTVQDAGGNQSLGSSAALEGSAAVPARRAPRQGASAGPDLLDVQVTAASFNEATFTFDEPIYPGLVDDDDLEAINQEVGGEGPDEDADRFAFFGAEGCPPGCPRVFGANVVAVNNSAGVGQVVVRFAEGEGGPAGDIQDARRFTVLGDTVSSLQGNENTSEAFSVGPTFSPELTEAAQVSANTFELTYDEAVSVNFVECYVLYTDDGQRAYRGSGFTRPVGGDRSKVQVSFAGAQGFNEKVVKVAEDATRFGCATDTDSPARQSLPATIGVRETNQAPGFSDAPDLIGVETGPGNTARFRFDSPVDPAQVQATENAPRFQLVQAGGTAPPFEGTAVEGVDQGDVTVRFAAQSAEQVAAAVGGRIDEGAACDLEQAIPDGPMGGFLKRQLIQPVAAGGGPAATLPEGGPPEGDTGASDEGDNDCSPTSTLGTSTLPPTSTTTGTTTGTTTSAGGTGGTGTTTGATTTGAATPTTGTSGTSGAGATTGLMPGRPTPTAVRPTGSARQVGRTIRGTISGRLRFTEGRGCEGAVSIAIRFVARRRIRRRARINSACALTARFRFPVRRLPARLRPRRRALILRIAYRFQGNALLRSDLSPQARLRVRR